MVDAIEESAKAMSAAVFCRNGNTSTPAFVLGIDGANAAATFGDMKAFLAKVGSTSNTTVRKVYDYRRGRFINALREIHPGNIYIYMEAHGERYRIADYAKAVDMSIFGEYLATITSSGTKPRRNRKVTVTSPEPTSDAHGDSPGGEVARKTVVGLSVTAKAKKRTAVKYAKDAPKGVNKRQLDRRRMAEKQKEDAAIVLQKHYRGVLGRRRAAELKEETARQEEADRAARKAAQKRRKAEKLAKQQRLAEVSKPRFKKPVTHEVGKLNRAQVLPGISEQHGRRRPKDTRKSNPDRKRNQEGVPLRKKIPSITRKASSVLKITDTTLVPLHAESTAMPSNVVYYWLKPSIPASHKSWALPWPEYEPMHYTHKSVQDMPPWADDEALVKAGCIRFNELCDGVDRRSFCGKYSLDGFGYPMNPMGRQGITGRGTLGRFGPNHAADPIVSRWKRDPNGKLVRDAAGDSILEVVLVKRQDNGSWALPGGMVDPNDTLSRTLKKEFGEEALNTLEMDEKERAHVWGLVNSFFTNGKVVYKGMVDDPRNTDCAWMETTAVLFHDDAGHVTRKFDLKPGDDAGDVCWTEIRPDLHLYAGHTKFLLRARDIILENSPLMGRHKGTPNEIAKQDRRVKNFKRWQFLHGLYMAKRDVSSGQRDFPENIALKHFDPKYHETLSDPTKALLLQCINPGLVVGHSVDGCVLFKPADFYKLQPYFTKVMTDLHHCSRDLHAHINPASSHGNARCKNSDFDLERHQVGPSLVRIRLARNLGSFPLSTAMTRHNRVALEEAVLLGIEKMVESEGMKGTYYSLTPGHPSAIDDHTMEQLQKENTLFEDLSLDRFAFASGQASDWPIGRGCWINDEKTLTIWVGEEDHVKVIAWTRSRYLNKAYKLCRKTMDDLEAALLKVGSLKITERGSAGWTILPEIGYVASRPSNCGTGMGASVKLYLPRLFEHGEELETVCKKNGVTCWRDQSPLSSMKGQVVIDVIQTMGISELKILSNLYAAVKALKVGENRIRESSSSVPEHTVESDGESNLAASRQCLGSRQRIRDVSRRRVSHGQTERDFAEAIEAVAIRVARQAVSLGLRCARDPHPHEHHAATRIQSIFRGYAARKTLRANAERPRRSSAWNLDALRGDTQNMRPEQMASQLQATRQLETKSQIKLTKSKKTKNQGTTSPHKR
eukprot:m.432069 g.432069  ORF g.432069 m.432069 type:complete len:1177 (-) comp17385_c0_seq1:1143-4673(-)